MNNITKEERDLINRAAINLYKIHRGKDRDFVIDQLMAGFQISKGRAVAAYGRARLYWNHPKRKNAIEGG